MHLANGVDDVGDDDVDYLGHWAQLIYCIVTLCY